MASVDKPGGVGQGNHESALHVKLVRVRDVDRSIAVTYRLRSEASRKTSVRVSGSICGPMAGPKACPDR
jgi:hypothetical protein